MYVLLLALVAFGLLFPMAAGHRLSAEAQHAHDLVEGLVAEPYVAVFADYRDPEGDRQLTALLRHILRRQGRVVVSSLSPDTAIRVERAVRSALSQAGAVYGRSVIHLGNRAPGGQQYAGACAAGFVSAAGSRDHAGEDLNLMPLAHSFRGIDHADLLALVLDGSGVPPSFGAWTASRYGVRSLVAASGQATGEASALASEGRLDAVIASGRSTSDYELLASGRRAAARYITALSLGTLFVLAIIIWAFLSGFLGALRRRRGGG
jgi:hypothetical protein